MYKDPEGVIFEHAETNRKSSYNKPLIDSAKIGKMDIEARKCLLYSQNDWKKMKRNLQLLKRSPLQVH